MTEKGEPSGGLGAAQVKSRTAKAASAAIIHQCMTPPLSPEPGVEPAPGPSRLELQ